VADRGADAAYAALLERARVDPAVVGVVVFGSRAAGRYATEASDVDAFVVVDGSPEAAAEWQTPHGSLVEVWAMTLDAFRAHALPGDAAAWNRPALIRARVDLDKLDGEIGRIVDRKRRLEPDEARALVDSALDDAINSMYRALRNLEGGRELGGRLDALESVGPLLTTVFALEGRVRPFNKWLAFELEQDPLRTPAFARLLEGVDALTTRPTAERIREAFRMLEGPARAGGHGAVVDGWEPDVGWLRGEAG
jgi:predicted nucleotidyltransferase